MARTQVMALERGHDGIVVRVPGEVFSLDLADPRFKGCTWFAPADKARPKAVIKPADKRPPGAGPIPGSAIDDEPPADGAAPPSGAGTMV